jgi:hypothetical protein
MQSHARRFTPAGFVFRLRILDCSNDDSDSGGTGLIGYRYRSGILLPREKTQ